MGAAILQPGPDGTLQPVAYASKILNNAEQNYSQIELESLAIVFGVTNYRQYLLGRPSSWKGVTVYSSGLAQ